MIMRVSRANGLKPSLRLILWTLALIAVCCMPHADHAQTAPGDVISPPRGFQPTASYALGGIETINTSNGNLMLNIPLAALPPGRGGHPGYRLTLRYNSKIWDGEFDVVEDPFNQNRTTQIVRLVTTEEGQGGWDYNLNGYSYYPVHRNSGGANYPITDPRRWNIYKLKVLFPDGGVHEFRPHEHDDELDDGYYKVPPAPGMSYYSVDGTYARLDILAGGWVLYFSDGTRVVSTDGAPQRKYDRNGNYTEISKDSNYKNTGHEADLVTDQLGRSIAVEHGAGEDYVHSTGVNGETLTTTVKWGNTYVSKTYRAGNHFQYDLRMTDQSVRVVKEIVLPSQAGGLKYTFGYNGWPTKETGQVSVGWGELSSVTLPSGARADYQYEMDNRSGGLYPANWVLDNSPKRKDLNYSLEYDGQVTAAPTETTYYALRDGLAVVTAPDGGVTTQWGGTRSYKTQLPDGTVIERYWKENRPLLPDGVTIHSSVHVNSFVEREFTSVPDATGALVKTAIKDYASDKNGNVTSMKEYDWVPYTSVHDASGSPLWTAARPAVVRETAAGYYAATPDASDSSTYDADAYHWPTSPRKRDAVSWTEARDASRTLSRTEFFYDDPATKGNLTQRKTWDSTKGAYSNPLGTSNSISTTTQYDLYGNPTLVTDGRGYQTKLTYGEVGAYADLYPTMTEVAYGTSIQRTTTTSYDLWTGLPMLNTDADNGVSTSMSYDALGRPTLVAAAGGRPEETRTVTTYDDGARRVVVRSDLDTAGDGKLVTIRHYDPLGRVRLTRTLEDASAQSATDETTGLKVQTRYRYGNPATDPYGYSLVSNPYRGATSTAGSEPTMGWSRARIDKGGRVVETQTFRGSSLPAPWGGNASSGGSLTTAYDAEVTTVVDQAGKARRSLTDALGRLARVDEPDGSGSLGPVTAPAQPTDYTYDALGNLRKVDQGGQLRFFMYDSLNRLIRARQPEQAAGAGASNIEDPLTLNNQWSMAYGYDAGGNLTTRVDARNVTTVYQYDALNRNTSVSYQNDPAGTPATVRTYDLGVNGKGRPYLVAQSGSVTSATYFDEYDALGRPRVMRQKFETAGVWSDDYEVTHTYDLAGDLKTQVYPSGHSVTYTHDNAGRLSGFTGNLGGGGAARAYADTFSYDASGRMSQERFGTDTPLYHKLHYNRRGQLYDIRLSTQSLQSNEWDWNRGAILNYYGSNYAWEGDPAAPAGTNNNGNLRMQQVFIPSNDSISDEYLFEQKYHYDDLNRLTSVAEQKRECEACDRVSTFTQAYDYDRWGNRTIDATDTQVHEPGALYTIPEPQFAVNAGTNRLGVPAGQSGRMGYDFAGNLTLDTYQGGQGGGGTRAYDAENRMTSAGFVAGQAQTATYVYDGDGRRVRRMVGTSSEVWQVYGAGGELLAEYGPHAAPGQPRKEYGYRGGELLVTAAPAAAPPVTPVGVRKNVALASNGGVASDASSTNQYHSLPAVNNGERKGPGHGGIWADSSSNQYPDWVQLDFAGAKAIDEVVVFSVQDNGYALSVEPTATMTGSQYVVTSFEVQYWTGSTWAAIPGGGVTGNNLIWRRVTFPELVTTGVRFKFNATGDNYSQVPEVEVLGRDTAGPRANHTLGSGASASTQHSANYPAAAAVNGDRHGLNWGAGGGWVDATSDLYPDWLEVDFGGGRRIDEVQLFGLQENYASPSEPTEAMTSRFAPTDFRVEYWTGSGWVTVPGGAVTGNNKVWRKLSFPEVTTSKVRVWVTRVAGDNHSAVVELEAWGPAETSADVRWLVADQLGTPRMVLDKTGSLAKVSRHDYLPFGEELPADVGGRTTTQGYGSGGNVRQKFTGYERDAETGLDYAQARYFASAQGRFMSVDPLAASASVGDPQSWNRYVYSYNNPLRYTDPSGMVPGDYYDEDGDWIGDDAVNDGRAYLVTNENEAQRMGILSRAGAPVNPQAYTSAIELPNQASRQEIGVDAVNRSNSPTSGNTPTDDTRGRFHEEGGITIQTANGQRAVPAEPGAVRDPRSGAPATMNPLSMSATNAQIVATATSADIDTIHHVHPSGTRITRSDGIETTHSFVQPPSQVDRDVASRTPTRLGYHIVVGAGNGTVYFYNGTGTVGTMPLGRFVNLPSRPPIR